MLQCYKVLVQKQKGGGREKILKAVEEEKNRHESVAKIKGLATHECIASPILKM